MKLMWTDQFILFLIEKVEAAEFIWNHKHNNYKNKLKKQIFWTALVDELNTCFEANVPFEYGEVIRKWNNLKSYYTLEKQKMFRALKSGAGAEAVESIWKFSKKMDFMLTLISTPSVNKVDKNSSHYLQGTNKIETDFSQPVQQPATTPTPSFLRMPSPLTVSTEYDPLMEYPESKPVISPPDLSPPLPSPFVLTSRSEERTCSPVHPNKRPRVARESDSPTATLIQRSNELSEALTRINSASEDSNAKTSFGNCIASELWQLDEDLQLRGKRRIFNIIWDLQAEQLERKANGYPPNNGY